MRGRRTARGSRSIHIGGRDIGDDRWRFFLPQRAESAGGFEGIAGRGTAVSLPRTIKYGAVDPATACAVKMSP